MQDSYKCALTPGGRNFVGCGTLHVRTILELAVAAFDGVEKLAGVVGHSILQDDLYVFDVGDVRRWISTDDHQVGILAGLDGADVGCWPR
jgi:hypothetical protein